MSAAGRAATRSAPHVALMSALQVFWGAHSHSLLYIKKQALAHAHRAL